MAKIRIGLSVFGMVLSIISVAQEKTVTDDSLYYNDWVGMWYKEVDGQLDDEPTFVVKQALYSSAFEEYWMGAGGDFSMAWRAWDARTKKWDFA